MASIFQNWMGNRSLFSWVFGDFFSKAQNTSGLLALVLVAAVIFMFIKNGAAPDRLLDAVLLIVGFYFGGATARTGKREPATDEITAI
jgi:uncharacterized membrane protein